MEHGLSMEWQSYYQKRTWLQGQTKKMTREVKAALLRMKVKR